MKTTTCVLCDDEGLNDRRSGLDICAACGQGHHLEARIKRWGLNVEERRWSETRRSGETTYTVHFLELQVSFPSPVQACATFRKETTFDRVTKFFGRYEPQGDEELFDRSVFVAAASGLDVDPLISDETVQSAIMELVCDGGVRMENTSVVAERVDMTEETELHQLTLSLVLLAIHLERFGRRAAER
jgi:hypothetical protein